MATESSRGKPSGILSLLWALFFFFIFALFVTIWIRWTGPGTAPQDQRSQTRVTKRQEIDQADAEKLNSAGFVDKAKGIVHLPLKEAQKIMLAELKTRQVVPSQVKVEPPLPMPPPPDSNATEPPPMALPSAPQGADTFRFKLPESNTVPATPESGVPAEALKPSAPAAPAAQPSAPVAPAASAPAPAAPAPATPTPATPAPAPAAPAPATATSSLTDPVNLTAATDAVSRPSLINWKDTSSLTK